MQKILLFITAIWLQFLATNSFADEAPDTAKNAVETVSVKDYLDTPKSADTAPEAKSVAAPEVFHEHNNDQYFDWAFFMNKQGSKNLCYITATAIKQSGEFQNRGEPYFIITKTKGKLPEVSVSSGYYYKQDSQLELSFGLQKFYLLTFKSRSWTYSIDDDIEIIKAMRNGDSVIVTATSNLNIPSQDTYSLIGFNKAFQRLQKECK